MGITVHLDKTIDSAYNEEAEAQFLDVLKKLKEKDEKNGVKYEPNMKRVKDFVSAYKYLEKEFSKTARTIQIKSGGLCADGWFINIVSNSITFNNPKEITDKVLRVADNFEIVPYLSGVMEFNVGFYGVMVEADK